MALPWTKKEGSIYRQCVLAAVLLSWSAASQAKSLSFVDVNAHTIWCLFSTNCKISTQQTAGVIPLFSSVSGKAWLRSRTFRGSRDSPAAGNRGYQYQVDLTQATSLAEAPCVTDLSLDFGEVVVLKYGPAVSGNDVYVVARDEPGLVGLFAAEIDGSAITVTFREPVCAGINAGIGAASYFVGVTSPHPPTSIAASIRVPGQPAAKVTARAPDY